MADVVKGFAPTLSDDTAHATIMARRRDQPRKLLASDCDLVEVGAGWELSFVDRACRRLGELIGRLESDGVKVDSFNFDRRACSLLHRELRLPPQLAASDGFWRWMAVEKASKVIEKRMGRPTKGVPANQKNYGIGTRNISDNRLAILWLRADLLYDDEDSANNPYHLAERHLHTDFFESGILRHRYGWCSNLARALVRFQYREEDGRGVYLHSTDQRGVRELYKRLRHLHSVYAFEFMTDGELADLLKKNSRDLLRAKP